MTFVPLTPTPGDSEATLLAKILIVLQSGAGAGTAGHGAPTSTPTTQLTWYVDLDTDTVYLWYGGVWHP